MTDLASAVQRAVYDALVGGVTLAAVHQHVPEGTPPPVVIIGEGDFSEEGGKGERLERHEVMVLTVVRGPGKLPLRAVQEQVRAALHDRPLTAAGASLSSPSIVSTSDQLLEDGETYAGTQQFVIWAEPA